MGWQIIEINRAKKIIRAYNDTRNIKVNYKIADSDLILSDTQLITKAKQHYTDIWTAKENYKPTKIEKTFKEFWRQNNYGVQEIIEIILLNELGQTAKFNQLKNELQTIYNNQ